MGKVIDSRNPELKEGDLVWGKTGWEEYSLLKSSEGLSKIQHTDTPLSYYTGILGNFLKFWSNYGVVSFFFLCYNLGLSPHIGHNFIISYFYGKLHWYHPPINKFLF